MRRALALACLVCAGVSVSMMVTWGGSIFTPVQQTAARGGVTGEAESSGRPPCDVLRIAVPHMPFTLDPALATDEVSLMVVRNVFSGLFRREPDGSVVPDLAESWEVSEDGLVYTFHLKKGIKFHDGTEVKARDFVRSIDRTLLHPLRTAVAGNLLSDIEGAGEVMTGEAEHVSGVSAPDDHTVVIKVARPEVFLPYALAEPVTFVVLKPGSAEGRGDSPATDEPLEEAYLQNARSEGAAMGVGRFAGGLLGTGPYRVVSVDQGSGLTLEAFEGYCGGPPGPGARTVSLVAYSDDEAALSAYERGAVDVMEVPREWVDRCMRSPVLRSDLCELPGREVYLLGLSPAAYTPFQDARVRRAVAHAIDREALAGDILKGERAALRTLIPPGVDGHDPFAEATPFDPQFARELLEDAEAFLKSAGISRPYRPLTLLTADSETAGAVAGFVTDSIRVHLGIETSVVQLVFEKLLEEIEKGRAEAFLIGWVPGRADPDSYVGALCASGSPYNYVHFESEYINDVLERAARERDPQIRANRYALADRLAVAEARWIPLYSSKRFVLIHPRIREFTDKHRYDLVPIQ